MAEKEGHSRPSVKFFITATYGAYPLPTEDSRRLEDSGDRGENLYRHPKPA